MNIFGREVKGNYTRKTSVRSNVVCQSRNWEVFCVVLLGETVAETRFKTRVPGLDKLDDLHPDPDSHSLILDKSTPAAIQRSPSQISMTLHRYAHTSADSVAKT